MDHKTIQHRVWFIAAGISLACASLFPETLLSLGFGWCTAMLMAWRVKCSDRVVLDFTLMGLVFHLISFYWVPDTLEYFGGFDSSISLILFFVFCVVSSLQFSLCGLLFKRFAKSRLARYQLDLAVAWFVCELFVPRMFPWLIGYSQVVWKSFSSFAEVAGAVPIGFVMVWLASLAVQLVQTKARQQTARTGVVVALVFALLLVAGYFRSASIEQLMAEAPVVRVGMIQGNLDAKTKNNLRLFDTNIARYRELTKQAIDAGADLIIWPEVVINHWMPENLPNIKNTRFEPYPNSPVPIIYGTLAFREKDPKAAVESERYGRYNSAVSVSSAGDVTGIYHKKVLMPFGEYLPFAELFPSLKKLSPNTGDFSVGDLSEPMQVELAGDGEVKKLSVAALICYEDLIPSLSQDAVLRGAQVLANLTNDAWYGETAAAYQHHLLAMWRAIETRKFLLRVTNTGYTGAVDPLGRTIAELGLFTSGFKVVEVRPFAERTWYVRFGDLPAQVLAVLLALCGFFPARNEYSGSQN